MIECSKVKIEGLLLFKPLIHKDERGTFSEVFKVSEYNKYLPEGIEFIQDNQSVSSYGVLRGLHFQKSNFEQSKLIRVSYGEIQDVVVDIRTDSTTFGHHFSTILNQENGNQLFIPKGFAHGFLTLSDIAVVNYKVDNVYSKKNESGILFNDSSLNIGWNINIDKIKVSKKDLLLPTINQI